MNPDGGSGRSREPSLEREVSKRDPHAGFPPPGRRMLGVRLVRVLEPGWHTAVPGSGGGSARWLVLPQPALLESILISAMKNSLQVPRIIIYYYCSVLAESALTALQYFPFAEEFPLLSLQVIIPNHSEQQ